jgi:hypothetical protein
MKIRILMTTLALSALASPLKAADIQRSVQVGGSTIDVSVSGELPVSEAALFRWIESSARGVAEYLGRYPVPRVRLMVRAGGRGGVGHGVTYGGRSPSIRIAVGRDATDIAFMTIFGLATLIEQKVTVTQAPPAP